ncbi:MAG: ATP-binding protein [Bacteriovoracaceae bacterium]|nr:ATP-binding protein [Bacteriovoracaceae bacterium]
MNHWATSIILSEAQGYVIYFAFIFIVFLFFAKRTNLYTDHRKEFWQSVLFTVGFSLVSSFILVQITTLIKKNEKAKLLGYAPTFSATFQMLGHESINFKTKNDDKKYLELIEIQKIWLSNNNFINDIYTMKLDDEGNNRFLVDSETDYDKNGIYEGESESRTLIGEVYEKKLPELDQAYQGIPSFTEEPYTDKWGTWVSAFVPLYDKAQKQIGVLGVDYFASEYISIRNLYLYLGMFTSIFIYSVMTLLFYYFLIAQHSLKAKEQFTAKIGHELRTPLNGIIGIVEVLKMNFSNQDKKVSDYYDMILSSANSLLSIVNEILDFAKLKSGKFKLQEKINNFHKIIEEVSNLFEVLCNKKNISWKLNISKDVPREFKFDEVKLKQVLLNLLSNALKFTTHGGISMSIELEKDLSKENSLKIIVEDTGIGMNQETVSSLFTPYYQGRLNNHKLNELGTGLGLCICQDLVHLMKGRLLVSSEVNKGSRFEIIMPINVKLENPVEGIFLTSMATSKLKRRAIVVEDVEINQIVLKNFLKKLNFEVDIFSSPLLALSHLQKNDDSNNYGLIFVDFNMPELSGIEFIKKLDLGVKSKIILCSAEEFNPEDVQNFMASGVSEILPKPIKMKELESLISKYDIENPENLEFSENPKKMNQLKSHVR